MRGRFGDGSLHGRWKAPQRWQRFVVKRPLGKRSKLAWEMEGAAEMMVALHETETSAEIGAQAWGMEGAA